MHLEEETVYDMIAIYPSTIIEDQELDLQIEFFRKTYLTDPQRKRYLRSGGEGWMVETRPNRDEGLDLRSRAKTLKRRRAKREFRTRLIHVSAAAG